MINWKAVSVALGLALGWIVGNPAVALGPAPDPQAEVQVNIARVEGLMEHLAALYMANGSYDAALGPLARALQLDPHRRSLWVTLDSALRHLGRQRISDEELVLRAARFKEGLAVD